MTRATSSASTPKQHRSRRSIAAMAPRSGAPRATDPLADDVPYALRRGFRRATCCRCRPPTRRTIDVAQLRARRGARRQRRQLRRRDRPREPVDDRRRARRQRAHRRRRYARPARVPRRACCVTAGGFAARDRTSTGGTIDAQLLRGHRDARGRRARVDSAGPPIRGCGRRCRRPTACARGVVDAGPDA